MLQRYINEWPEPDFSSDEKALFALLSPFRGYFVLNFFERHFLGFLVENAWLDGKTPTLLSKTLEKAHQHGLLELSEENGWYLAQLCPGLNDYIQKNFPSVIRAEHIEEAFLNYAHEASRGALYYFLRVEEDASAAQEGVEIMRYEEANVAKALHIKIERKVSVAYYFTVLNDFYRYQEQYLERLMFASGVLTAMLAIDFANTNDETWLDYLGIQNAFADACLQMNMLEAAEKMLRAAIEMAEQAVEDPRAKIYLGYTCHNLGMALSRQHRPDDSVAFLTMAMDLLKDSDDDEIKGQIALNLGVVKLDKKETDNAQEAFEKAKRYFEKTGAHSETAFAMQNLGLAAEQKNDPETAKKHYAEASSVFQKFGNDHSAAQIQINLGSLAGDAGDLDESIRYFKDALTTFLRLDDDYYQALCYRNIGVAHTHQGHWEKAAEMLFRALQLLTRFQLGRDIRRVFNNIKLLAERSENPAFVQDALQILVNKFEVPLVEELTGYIIKVE